MDIRKQTIDTYDLLAKAYQDKFMEFDLYNDTYDQFCGLIKLNDATVFEIGCGPGNITKYLLAKRPDLKIDAIDAAPNMIALAKKNNPLADFEVMDCREIGKLSRNYDAIICGFCMPYLSKDESCRLIADAGALLKENGVFYLSVIEDAYEKSGLETSSDGKHSMYVYRHQADYLLESITQSQMKSKAVIRKKYHKLNGQSETHLVIIAQKNK